MTSVHYDRLSFIGEMAKVPAHSATGMALIRLHEVAYRANFFVKYLLVPVAVCGTAVVLLPVDLIITLIYEPSLKLLATHVAAVIVIPVQLLRYYFGNQDALFFFSLFKQGKEGSLPPIFTVIRVASSPPYLNHILKQPYPVAEISSQRNLRIFHFFMKNFNNEAPDLHPFLTPIPLKHLLQRKSIQGHYLKEEDLEQGLLGFMSKKPDDSFPKMECSIELLESQTIWNKLNENKKSVLLNSLVEVFTKDYLFDLNKIEKNLKSFLDNTPFDLRINLLNQFLADQRKQLFALHYDSRKSRIEAGVKICRLLDPNYNNFLEHYLIMPLLAATLNPTQQQNLSQLRLKTVQEIVEKKGANIRILGRPLLMWVVKYGLEHILLDRESIKFLLKNSADPTLCSNHLEDIHNPSLKEYVKMSYGQWSNAILYLLQNPYLEETLRKMLSNPNVNFAGELAAGLSPDELVDGEPLLVRALEANNLKATQTLLAAGATKTEAAIKLLSYLISTNAQWKQAFENEEWEKIMSDPINRLPRIKEFISMGGDINQKIGNSTLLFLAICHRAAEVVEFLIKKNVNMQDAAAKIAYDSLKYLLFLMKSSPFPVDPAKQSAMLKIARMYEQAAGIQSQQQPNVADPSNMPEDFWTLLKENIAKVQSILEKRIPSMKTEKERELLQTLKHGFQTALKYKNGWYIFSQNGKKCSQQECQKIKKILATSLHPNSPSAINAGATQETGQILTRLFEITNKVFQ